MKENENNFESLRRLLALKRHETPPPGYFENFSDDVMARLRAGGSHAVERPATELPWLFRVFSTFETKPAFAGGFAFALCLLLVVGIVYAERPDVALQPLLQTAQISNPLPVAAPATLNSLSVEQPGLIAISSTNPVFDSQSPGSWFPSQQQAMAQPVSFTLPGN